MMEVEVQQKGRDQRDSDGSRQRREAHQAGRCVPPGFPAQRCLGGQECRQRQEQVEVLAEHPERLKDCGRAGRRTRPR